MSRFTAVNDPIPDDIFQGGFEDLEATSNVQEMASKIDGRSPDQAKNDGISPDQNHGAPPDPDLKVPPLGSPTGHPDDMHDGDLDSDFPFGNGGEIIDEDDEDDEDEHGWNRRNTIKRVRPTEKGLIDAMGFDTKETLYEWLTSDVCGEFFKDVYIHRLYPEQQRTGTRSRSPRPEVVKLLIKRREDDGELRYILRRNTHEWTAAGWACYFLLHTRFLNTRYIDGAFFGKQVTESEVDIALWTAYLFLVNKHAPSRLYRTPLLRKFSKDLVAAAQSLHGVPGVKGTKRPAEETETPPSLPQSSKRKKTQKSGHDGASATPAEEAATDTEGQPAAKPTTLDWKEEANAPRKAKRHEPMSVTFNIQDPYWRPSLLRPTFQKAERAPLRTDNDQKHDQGEGEEDDDEDDDEDSDEDDDEDGDGDQKDGDEDLLNAYLEQLLGPGIVGG